MVLLAILFENAAEGIDVTIEVLDVSFHWDIGFANVIWFGSSDVDLSVGGWFSFGNLSLASCI